MNCLFCSAVKIMKPEGRTSADLCLLSYLLFMFSSVRMKRCNSFGG
jgi:hypothetical protein